LVNVASDNQRRGGQSDEHAPPGRFTQAEDMPHETDNTYQKATGQKFSLHIPGKNWPARRRWS
jgi:hypothetical protein